MRIAIIGAGFTGLTTAYKLAKAGHKVRVFEKSSFAGGLASGIRPTVNDYPLDWEWDLERFYHHWFTNDREIVRLARKLGVENKLLTLNSRTALYYQGDIHSFDSPLSVLAFPYLDLTDRLRLGAALAYLKLTPDWRSLEKVTAHQWWRKWIGEQTYSIIWEPLLKGKFGKDSYQDINMAWFWARIKKRTSKLRYFEGGFQTLINILVETIKSLGGQFYFQVNIQQIKPQPGSRIQIRYHETNHGNTLIEKQFDRVIVTAPPAVLKKLAPDLPINYQEKLDKLPGIGAYCLILALNQPFLADNTYWLNINQPDFPFLAVVEHTNLVSSKHYGGKHLLYISNYLPANHPDLQMNKEELLKKLAPHLQKINPNFQFSLLRQGYGGQTIFNFQSWLFREPYAQPLVFINHSRKVLPLKTPIPGLYLASMSQVYPWDRGTNYAVELGQRVAELMIADS